MTTCVIVSPPSILQRVNAHGHGFCQRANAHGHGFCPSIFKMIQSFEAKLADRAQGDDQEK